MYLRSLERVGQGPQGDLKWLEQARKGEQPGFFLWLGAGLRGEGQGLV